MGVQPRARDGLLVHATRCYALAGSPAEFVVIEEDWVCNSVRIASSCGGRVRCALEEMS